MLLGTLVHAASIIWNTLTRTGKTSGGLVIRAGGKSFRNLLEFLITSHPLTNFEIQTFSQNERTFNGVYSRNNLPEINDGYTYLIWMSMN